MLEIWSACGSKEEAKQAAKRLADALKPIVRAGVVVANEKWSPAGKDLFLTKLNLFFDREVADLASARTMLLKLSDSWVWELGSADPANSNLAYGGIDRFYGGMQVGRAR